MKRFISTHTLRGERDKSIKLLCFVFNIFQLTRSVGSVTCRKLLAYKKLEISTHTLRGERDLFRHR